MSTHSYETFSQNVPLTQPMISHQNTSHQSQNVVMQQAIALGPNSIIMTCPRCHASIKTAVSNTPSCGTHMMCLFLFVICCSMGCCVLPYCMNSCQSQKHTCPNCEFVIGVFQR